ncbi:hypothetical protein EKK58_06245 [Candidatus Dependentiae bacterium]|nr:MAG: hypothetical protein EKK58_06245 [Candidatus Dependentiae bacterium]
MTNMKKPHALDDLEMHELLRLLYPEHIRSDDDDYFELSQQACESMVDLGDGFEVRPALTCWPRGNAHDANAKRPDGHAVSLPW